MTDNHITPEELRACADAEVGNALGDGRAYEAAAALIEALQAERDGLAATVEQVRGFTQKERDEIHGRYDLAGAVTSDYRGYANACDDVLGIIAAPSVSLAHVKAEALRWAGGNAMRLGTVSGSGVKVGERAQNFLAQLADQIESEASNG